MAESTIWWLLAGTLVAVELATGTFYLLMMGIGLSAGALAAHAGLALSSQIVVAAGVGGGAVAAWHWLKAKGPKPAQAEGNPDVHIDIGEAVQVEHWNTDGTTTVKYRGASWMAVAETTDDTEPEAQLPGQFRIKRLLGNRLVLQKV